MARFAGQALNQEVTPRSQKPVLPGFNAEDLKETPEMRPGPYYPGQDLDRDKYIRHNPRSGVASSGGGQEVAALPAFLAGPALVKGVAAVGAAAKKVGAGAVLKKVTGMTLGGAGAVNPGTRADYNNQDPTTKYNRRKQNDYRGPASQSPYHQ